MTDIARTACHADDRVALVTGGSRGIGAAIVRRLAADGATVGFTYSTSTQAADALIADVERKGGRCFAIKADAREPAQVVGAFGQVYERFQHIDILVNNVGISIMKPIEAYTVEDFHSLVTINLGCLFLSTREAMRGMRAGGRIINIGSINSEYVPVGGRALYVMTKAAVSGFTTALGRELGERGITVNNVMPGPTDTEMNPAHTDAAARNKAHTALGRYGEASEIASVVSFLASAESAFVTAACLPVDGGYSA